VEEVPGPKARGAHQVLGPELLLRDLRHRSARIFARADPDTSEVSPVFEVRSALDSRLRVFRGGGRNRVRSAGRPSWRSPNQEKAEEWNKWDSMVWSQSLWLQRSKNWLDKRLFVNPKRVTWTGLTTSDYLCFNQCVLYPHERRTERRQKEPRTTCHYESRSTVQLRHRPC